MRATSWLQAVGATVATEKVVGDDRVMRRVVVKVAHQIGALR
jgi:hypothetical protein